METKSVLLFVDATLQHEKDSRTYKICQSYIDRWKVLYPDCEIQHIVLNHEPLTPLCAADIKERESLVANKDFSNKALAYARAFSQADHIVIGAPYWELSFPAILKLYIERVSICGITFCYTDAGVMGLCKAKRLVYVTSAGGYFNQYDLGTQYIRGLCESLWYIPEFRTVAAQGLDIVGADIEGILDKACMEAVELVNA